MCRYAQARRVRRVVRYTHSSLSISQCEMVLSPTIAWSCDSEYAMVFSRYLSSTHQCRRGGILRPNGHTCVCTHGMAWHEANQRLRKVRCAAKPAIVERVRDMAHAPVLIDRLLEKLDPHVWNRHAQPVVEPHASLHRPPAQPRHARNVFGDRHERRCLRMDQIIREHQVHRRIPAINRATGVHPSQRDCEYPKFGAPGMGWVHTRRSQRRSTRRDCR